MIDSPATPPAPQTAERESRRIPFMLIVIGAIVFLAAQIGFVRVNSEINRLGFASTETVDMAGFERTLTQRMLGSALLIQRQERNGTAVISSHAELVAAEHVFDSTLAAFTHGGKTENSAGSQVRVDALATPGEIAIVSAIDTRWHDLRPKVDALGNFAPPRAAIDALATSALALTPQLSVLMNDLSEEVEKTTVRNVAKLSAQRYGLIALSIAGLVIVVVGFFLRVLIEQRRVRRSAREVEARNEDLARSSAALLEAKAQEDLIMQTVRQGLFLIDKTSGIQGEYSKELESIFHASGSLVGASLLGILAPLVPPKALAVAEDYIALLFDRNKHERLIAEINPLVELEVNFPNQGGGFESRFLAFSFRRIVTKKTITRIFVAVNDITDAVTLERALRESEKRKERQFEMLLGILAVDAGLFEDFLVTANEQVSAMSETLRREIEGGRANVRTEAYRERLDTIFRSVHNIKGNASLLGLDFFVRATEAFEAAIVELRNRSTIAGDDFLALLSLQSQLRDDLAEAREVRNQLTSVARPTAAPATAPPASAVPASAPERVGYPGTSPLQTSLVALAHGIASDRKKRISFEMSGFDAHPLAPEVAQTLEIVLPELVRYSTVDGIEAPHVREALGKNAIGTILVRRVEHDSDDFFFTYRDDGVGFDANAIRQRAAAAGLLDDAASHRMTDLDAIRLLFSPEYLRSRAHDDGEPNLQRIKARIVDERYGEMQITSDAGKFVEFSFRLYARVEALR